MKILRAYTPAAGLEERVSPALISSVEVGKEALLAGVGGGGSWLLATTLLKAVSLQKRLQEQQAGTPGQLLVDTNHLFPVHLPFIPSPLRLDELCIPDSVDLAFLVRL